MPDGYHELDSVMVELSLCDDVSVTLYESVETHIEISVPGFRGIVPENAGNTAAQAAIRFLERLSVTAAARIGINKRIPVGAGLGGGSADAAAVLRAMNALFGAPFDSNALREIGVLVGADIPFCVDGGTARAKGRGELLTPLAGFPSCDILLCKPEFSISTAALYSRLDSVKITARPDTDGLCAAIAESDLRGAAHRCFNVFEQALPSDKREIVGEIQSRLLESGALCAVMTGTGSAVFGIFDNADNAKTAESAIAADCTAFLCKPHKRQA